TFEQRDSTRWIADMRPEAGNPDLLALTMATGASLNPLHKPLVMPMERSLQSVDFTGLLKPLLEACVEAGARPQGAEGGGRPWIRADSFFISSARAIFFEVCGGGCGWDTLITSPGGGGGGAHLRSKTASECWRNHLMKGMLFGFWGY